MFKGLNLELMRCKDNMRRCQTYTGFITDYNVLGVRQLIEAVMGGDRPLQDRMNYRSGQVAKDRQELRDAAAGKPKKVLPKFMTNLQSVTNKRKANTNSGIVTDVNGSLLILFCSCERVGPCYRVGCSVRRLGSQIAYKVQCCETVDLQSRHVCMWFL